MNTPLTSFAFWRDRLRASGIHLGISLCIAALAAVLVFLVWYPSLYREISGGRELFLLVVTVDVILGPLITLAVFNRSKPITELRRDLAIVGLLQLSALVYGLWTVSMARPVHLVFEIDRFRVVHAIDIAPELLQGTPIGIDALPLTGPTLLAVRPFKDSRENMEATMMALQGLQLAANPQLWQPYAKSVTDVLKIARSASELRTRFAARAAEIDRTVNATGRDVQNLVYLPLMGRNAIWTLLLDSRTAQPLATLPLDSF